MWRLFRAKKMSTSKRAALSNTQIKHRMLLPQTRNTWGPKRTKWPNMWTISLKFRTPRLRIHWVMNKTHNRLTQWRTTSQIEAEQYSHSQVENPHTNQEKHQMTMGLPFILTSNKLSSSQKPPLKLQHLSCKILRFAWESTWLRATPLCIVAIFST